MLTSHLQHLTSTMNSYCDTAERQDPEQRERALMRCLPELIRIALQTPGWRGILGDIDPMAIRTRRDLQSLPITRKLDLVGLQARRPPLGGIYATPANRLRRLFMSPGPIFEAHGPASDWWRTARPLNALGLKPGHVLHNCFSYHLTPGAFLIDDGAQALGCTVVPAGPGQTEQQINAVESLKPDAYAGTPSFLKHIITRAHELGRNVSSLKRALVSAEPLPPALRTWLQENGVERVLQFYGTADAGAIAYETVDENNQVCPGMILNEELILEIIDPASGQPVADGQVGEVVLTSLNPLYPLVRFGTGDLSAVLPGASPCGRTNVRITGWQGRADDLVKVRGMFIHPGDIEKIRQRHPDVERLHLAIDNAHGTDNLTLHVVVNDAGEQSDNYADRLATTFRELTRLRAAVRFTHTLPDHLPLVQDKRNLEPARMQQTP